MAPRFRALADDEIMRKHAGEVVTAADRACEELLTELLRDIVDAPVIGEEATAASPVELDRFMADGHDGGPAWIVDPIDGTRRFVSGEPEYGVMVAFAERGRTTAAWILLPQLDQVVTAQLGAGAERNGEPLVMPEPAADPGQWQVLLKNHHMPAEVRDAVAGRAERFRALDHQGSSAALEYLQVAQGKNTALGFWRTKPWDHAPGALIVEEAGGLVLRPDGRRYGPTQHGEGILSAHASIADEARRLVFGDAG
ncbi:MAG: inositol monophosphatase family protein [Actinomycetota bacterium]